MRASRPVAFCPRSARLLATAHNTSPTPRSEQKGQPENNMPPKLSARDGPTREASEASASKNRPGVRRWPKSSPRLLQGRVKARTKKRIRAKEVPRLRSRPRAQIPGVPFFIPLMMPRAEKRPLFPQETPPAGWLSCCIAATRTAGEDVAGRGLINVDRHEREGRERQPPLRNNHPHDYDRRRLSALALSAIS